MVPLYVYSGLTVTAIVALWWLAARLELVSPVFLPLAILVARSAWSLITVGFVDSTLAEHVAASLGRILGGLLVSILLGVPAGLAIGTSRIGRGILDPIVRVPETAATACLSAARHHLGWYR